MKLHLRIASFVVFAAGCSVASRISVPGLPHSSKAEPKAAPAPASPPPASTATTPPPAPAHVASTKVAKAELKEEAPAPLPPVKDEGVTSALHGQHPGEIVFATRPIARDAKSDPGFTNAVEPETSLYARVYLRESLGNTTRRAGLSCSDLDRERIVRVQIGDAPEKEWIWLADMRMSQANFDDWTTYVLTEKADEALNSGRLSFEDHASARYRWATEVIPALADGENKLTFHAMTQCPDRQGNEQSLEVATGTLTVTVRAGAREAYAKKHGPFLAKSQKVGGKDLAPALRELAARSWHNDAVLAAVIVGSAWRVERDSWDLPVRRMLDGQVVVHQENERSCRIFTVAMSQKALGLHDFAENLELFVGEEAAFTCPTTAK